MTGAPSLAGGPTLGGGGAGAGGTSSNPWSLRNSVGGTGTLGSSPVVPPVTPPGAATDPAVAGRTKVRPRNEFVVVFVWKEPTPSDKLISTEVKK